MTKTDEFWRIVLGDGGPVDVPKGYKPRHMRKKSFRATKAELEAQAKGAKETSELYTGMSKTLYGQADATNAELQKELGSVYTDVHMAKDLKEERDWYLQQADGTSRSAARWKKMADRYQKKADRRRG